MSFETSHTPKLAVMGGHGVAFVHGPERGWSTSRAAARHISVVIYPNEYTRRRAAPTTRPAHFPAEGTTSFGWGAQNNADLQSAWLPNMHNGVSTRAIASLKCVVEGTYW